MGSVAIGVDSAAIGVDSAAIGVDSALRLVFGHNKIGLGFWIFYSILSHQHNEGQMEPKTDCLE